MEEKTGASALYSKLMVDRTPYLERAYECSELTLPALLPRDGHTAATDLPTPYQSFGARGVNNIAAKLLLALFPTNTPFFKLAIDDFTLEELTKQEGMRAQVEEGLNRVERAVQSEYEARAMSVSLFEALKHAVVVGNVLIYIAPTGELRVFRLDRYVVQRDAFGNVLNIVTHETVAYSALPEATRMALAGEMKEQDIGKPVDLFTHVRRNVDKWEIYQEVKGKRVDKSEGTYPLDKSPWIALRWTKIDGESYGRGYVEEYLGDIKSLEGLSQAIIEGSAAMAKLLFLVNPNGTTDKDDVSTAENGAVIDGNATDVTVLQANKAADLSVASNMVNRIEERLAFAFLLNSSIQRKGERVTAEEIRFMAQELEDALGGIYSIFSQELQLPMVTRIMLQMEKAKKLPTLPKGVVKPVIVAGFASLGRGQDLAKLNQFVSLVSQLLNLPTEIDKSDLVKRIGTALGIDMKGLVKTPEVIQAEQQQQLQQQMMLQASGPAAQAMSNVAEKRMTPDAS